jgi:trimeric autotransporter adhesin
MRFVFLMPFVLFTAAVSVVTACSSDDNAASSSGGASTGDASTGDSSVSPATYTVTASVVGLTGTGLVLKDQSNGSEIAVAPMDGTTQKVAFPVKLASGAAYDVRVKAQPGSPLQSCEVMGGSGKVVAGNVESITVNCSNRYSIGGTVTGLEGTGLILQNNAGDDLPVNANGTFAFPGVLANGASYAVTVKAQPTNKWQTCTLTSAGSDGGVADSGATGDAGVPLASGTIANANVTNIAVTCTTNVYPVAVKVTGLAGIGLVFQNNLSDDLAVATDGTYTFATTIRSGSAYSVTTLTNPTSKWQTCTVAAPAGSMAGAAVTLNATCTTNKYTIEGTFRPTSVAVTLKNNGGDDLTVGAGKRSFAFATSVASGDSYDVSVGPAAAGCFVSSGKGTVSGAKITDVSVYCPSNTTATAFEPIATWPTAPYTQVGATGGTLTAGCAHDGAAGLSNPDWSLDTSVNLGNPGDVLSVWAKTLSGRIYLSFGGSTTGAWSLVIAPNTSTFLIQRNANFDYLDLASVPFTYTNQWYRMEVRFGAAGLITGNLYDSDGVTQLATVSTTPAGFTPGGIALRGFGTACIDSLAY